MSLLDADLDNYRSEDDEDYEPEPDSADEGKTHRKRHQPQPK